MNNLYSGRALNCHDPVTAPNHYTWHPSGVECKQITMHFPHPVASAIEYLWRAGRKGDHEQHIQDLEKAREWIGIEIERVKTLTAREER